MSGQGIQEADVLVDGAFIAKIGQGVSAPGVREVACNGRYLIPGLIDDQVHFREPGLTHKATIGSESKAAVAGGITSFMEMPNTVPPALSVEELEKKYSIAERTSWANYSFYLGASNSNYDELESADYSRICGIKAFLGSSTGNLLVDDGRAIDQLFSITHIPIAVHCEDEARIRERNKELVEGRDPHTLPPDIHCRVRDERACYLSSSKAVAMARSKGTRLHVLHITTEEELELFDTGPVAGKRITAEVCIHHLHYTSEDYALLGNRIKCNPAIKAPRHRNALWEALNKDILDILATDHAPHTLEEKNQPYPHAPSGLPLVQHALPLLMQKVDEGMLSIETLVQKACHNPAILFDVDRRGFVEEGMYADLVLLDRQPWQVRPENVLYHCGWSPIEGMEFHWRPAMVMVSGKVMVENGQFTEGPGGMRLAFTNR